MVNNRMRLKSKEKWIINPMILNSIHERTGGNPRDSIRILKCLVDEKRDLGYQGTLENLMSFQVPKTPVIDEKVYSENKFSNDNYEPNIPVSEIIDNEVENDELIDEEPSDLWDFDDEETPLLIDNFSEEDDEITEKPIWQDNFSEIKNDLIDEETNTIEEDNIHDETELFMSPGTEPPERMLQPSPVTISKKFGSLRKRSQKATYGMKDDISPHVPITYADGEPSQSTLDNYVGRETFKIKNKNEIDEPIISEARMDQNIQSIDYEIVDSIEGAEWSVEPSYQSTVPEMTQNPSASNDSLPNNESFIEEPMSQEPEIEEIIFEEPEIQNTVELVESVPIFPKEKDTSMINDSPTKKPRFSPIWEEDRELDVNRFYSLSDAERMILEVASIREISPSDDELQARLEVGRPRLSQLYNSLQKSGMLSVRKQGRTRLFKLSEAATNEF